MIHMKRPATDAPPTWTVKALEETKKAIAAYKAAVKQRRESSTPKAPLEFKFDYQVYGDVLLRDKLNDIYRYKCAYCETYYGASQPVAVEHYRPKGEVIEGTVRVKPAYYWLAANWENLLPSCTDCNSRRGQRADDGTSRVRGKGNYFPLAKGSKRAKTPGKEKLEKALLLHPERDQPEEHLEFLSGAIDAGVIRPAQANGVDSERGVASIEYYALDRPQLVEFRRKFARRLRSHLRNTRVTLRAKRAAPTDAQAAQDFAENIEDLRGMFAPGEPYIAMSRSILRKEFPEFATLF